MSSGLVSWNCSSDLTESNRKYCINNRKPSHKQLKITSVGDIRGEKK